MTDEELGRRWCIVHGRRPEHDPWDMSPHHPWRWGFMTELPHGLPHPVHKRLGDTRHRTEANAYADVGAALREAASECDRVRVIADEVRAIEGVNTSAD